MKSKIQSRTDYKSVVKGDPIKLLLAIQQHAMSYESTQYRMKNICNVLKSLVNLKQQQDGELSIDYLKRFNALRDVFYSHVGKNFEFPILIEDLQEYKTAVAVIESNATVQDKEKASAELLEVQKRSMDQFHASYLYLEGGLEDNRSKERC
jgi:hypothetical protein